MKRAFGCVGVVVMLIAATVGLLWPAFAQLSQAADTSSSTYDPVTITSYQGDFSVSTDGTLTATETLVADFPVPRHGLFRFWDRRDAADSHNRYTPNIESITQDGAPARYEVLEQGGGRYVVAKIGNPDAYLSEGTHTYVIRYTVAGAISPGTAGVGSYASSDGDTAASAPSAFYWNVVAPGWQNTIRSARIAVQLPSAALGVQCTAGVEKTLTIGRGPCTIAGTGTAAVTLGAEEIPPNSGMTTRIPMAIEAPSRSSVPWPILYDKVLGTSLLPVLLVVALTVLLLLAGLAMSRRTRESPPGFPVMYAPPQGLGPAQAMYVAEEETGSHAMMASILYLADRGVVKLEHRSDDSWLVTGIGDAAAWNNVDSTSRAVAQSLGVTGPGQWFLADGSVSAGKTLLAAKKSVDSSAASWAKGAGLVSADPRAQRGCALWGLAIILAIIGFIGWRWPTMWGLPFAAFVIGGAAMMNPKAQTRRTETGRRAWSESAGFRRMLSTPSSEERFDFAARKDLFIPYVPFAVVFGVADKWAAKYRAEMGQEPPTPSWYPMGVGYGIGSIYSSGGGFDSFDSSVSSAISAYQATQSSSGGGGGGGSFGGGGGGGGGGSW